MIWYDSSVELPPKDGWYKIKNTDFDESVIYYDGIGFYYEEHYVPAKFWGFFHNAIKKYGKIENSPMMEYKFDGKPHIINEKFAYILQKYSADGIDRPSLSNLEFAKAKIIKEYAKYLYENDRESSLNYIENELVERYKEDCFTKASVIHKFPDQFNNLGEYGTIFLKLERSENDNLTDMEKNHE